MRAPWFLVALLAAMPTFAGPAPEDAHEAGRRIWNFRCYYCHGYSGDARTLAASFLTPPPRSFQATAPGELSRARMIAAVRDGKPGTAMKPFRDVIPARDIERVVDFIQREFIDRRAPNTRYHTVENGWPDHDRYRIAFPFASGELAIDTPPDQLTPEQRRGLKLYRTSCVSCHDHGRVLEPGPVWESRPVSFPRHYDHRDPPTVADSVAEASPYAIHDQAPQIAGLSAIEQRGAALYQGNCAFCHAADGTGKNWIGRFMEPPARNLTDPAVMRSMTRARLVATIRDGLPGTSMPAWRHVLKSEEIEAIAAYVHRAFHPLADAAPGGARR